MSKKYYTKFSDETVQEAIDRHETGYESVDDAKADGDAEKTAYQVIDKKGKVFPDKK